MNPADPSTVVVVCLLMVVAAIARRSLPRVVVLLLALLVLNRFFRRFYDWSVGEYHAISPFSILGLAAVLVAAGFAMRKWPSLPKRERQGLMLISAALGYAFVLGFGRGLSAVMALASYAAPVAMYVLVRVSVHKSADTDRLVRTLGVMGIVVSLYGALQYAFVPQWDAFWMAHCGLTSIGRPVPFEIRVFSTLSDANIAGMFLAVALLPSLIERRWRPLGGVGIAIIFCGLGITLVRTSWLMVVAGFLMWVAVSSPRKSSRHLPLAIVSLAILAFIGPSLPGGQRVLDRISTFANLGSDSSATGRVRIVQETFGQAISNPIGTGFAGTGGVSGRLSAGESVSIDSGLTDLLITFGLPGLILGLAGLWLVVRSRHRGPSTAMSRMQVGLAVAVLVGLGSLNIIQADLGCVIAALFALPLGRSLSRDADRGGASSDAETWHEPEPAFPLESRCLPSFVRN